MNETRNRLKEYNSIKAQIRSIELDIEVISIEMEELGNEIRSSSPSPGSDRVQSSTISDSTSDKAIKVIEKTERLGMEKRYMETRKRELEITKARIENSMLVLTPQEKDVVTLRYLENKSWAAIQIALNDCTYSNVKRVESEAIIKLKPYLRKTVEKL